MALGDTMAIMRLMNENGHNLTRWRARVAALAGAWLAVVVAIGQKAEGPGSSGTTTGTVKDATEEWILVQPAGSLPRRHWFKWIDAGGQATNQAIQAAAARLKPEDRIEIRWSFDNRLRIESLTVASGSPVEGAQPAGAARTNSPGGGAASLNPAPAAATNPAPARPSATNAEPVLATNHAQPAATPGPPPSPPATGPARPSRLAETVNGLIDKLGAAGGRLLELPLFMILGGIALTGEWHLLSSIEFTLAGQFVAVVAFGAVAHAVAWPGQPVVFVVLAFDPAEFTPPGPFRQRIGHERA
jgi:hypothetical protein